MKNDHRRRVRIPALLALVSLPAIPHVHAADGTWDVDADGNWSDTGNWLGGTVADGADFTATFPSNISATTTVTLDSNRIIGNITFTDASDHLVISGANTLTLDTTTGTPTIQVDDEELTINSVIDGNDGLAKTGAGILRLDAANTFTGGIDLADGLIYVRSSYNPASLGDSSNVLTFSADARLHNVAGLFTMAQGVTINGGVTAEISGAFGERTRVDGVLAGSGTLLVRGYSAGYDAEFRNTGNTFTGPIEIQSGDSVTAGFASLADSAGATTIGLDSQSNNGARFEYMAEAIAPLVLNNRQFDLIVNGNAGTNLGRQPGIVNNAPTANTITVNTDLLVTGTGNKKFFLAGGNTGDNTFAGAITDAIDTDVLTLYKDNGGKWILTGVNTYEGDTIILNGTLEIGGAGQLGGGNYAGNISTGSNPFTFDSSADTTISGVISGAAELIKDGAGTLSLTNANTYAGDTTVDGGTLSLGDGTNSSELDDFATVSVATGAVLDLNYTGSDSVLLLNLGGSPAAAGTWGATGSGATNIDDTFFTGTGVINNLVTLPNDAFWDGGDVDILVDGEASSAGGTGTWDTSILNWDVGFAAHAAWANTTADTAHFGGVTGTVTLDADMSIGTLNIKVPNGGGSGYSIGDTAEDNTLTFGGAAEINVTATGSGSRNDHRIRAGIAGSPTVNVAGRNNNGAFFALEPPAGVTQTLGTLNMFNTRASNKQLRLGGASLGNVVDRITWTVTGNQLQVRKQDSTNGGADGSSWTVNQDISLDDGRIYVDEGTLIMGGTNNFMSHLIQIANGGRLVAQGDWRIHDEDQDLIIQSGGILAPGGSVGTMNLSWNNTRGNPGQVNFQSGAIYEWELGAGNASDVFNLQELGGSDAELLIGTGTFLKVIDAGGTPSAGDQLTVFTYDVGVVTPDTTALNANMTIDISGTTYTGSPSFVNDGAGTIYITGLASAGGGAPEIAVEEPAATDIPNGGSRDFGTVTIGSTSPLTFTIRNTGSADLNLTGSPEVDIIGTNPGDFSVTATPSTPVTMGGGTTTFTVEFSPTATGARSAQLSIANDDSDENPFLIDISGTGQTPYEAWASGGEAFDGDGNGDGVQDGLAFMLGAATPGTDASGLLTFTESGGNLVLTFPMLNAASRGASTLSVQHSSDLGDTDAWLGVVVPDASGGPTDGVTFTVTPGSPTNSVVASIDGAEGAAGKLFGRLEATE